MSSNITVCNYLASNSTIECVSSIERFECEVEANFEELKDLTVKLPNLNIVPQTFNLESKQINVLRLISRIESRYTLLNPRSNKEVTLSVYSSPVPSKESGFLVKDSKCLEKMISVVKDTKQDAIRFSLIVKA